MNKPLFAGSTLLEFAEIAAVDPVSSNRFVGRHNQPNLRRSVFGGQIIGQSLAAASHTVGTDRAPSEHKVLFLKPADVGQPICYEVEPLLEGGSFSIRRIRCLQNERLLADVTASFHRDDAGGVRHQDMMPTGIPGPEGLDNIETLVRQHSDRIPSEAVDSMTRPTPVELRPAHPDAFFDRPAATGELFYWMRIKDPLPDSAPLHYQAFAFMSDWWLSVPGFMQHTETVASDNFFVVSLNHTLWFHARPQADEWLLVHARSPAASGGRGLIQGVAWDCRGTLVAHMAQEALGRAAYRDGYPPTGKAS